MYCDKCKIETPMKRGIHVIHSKFGLDRAIGFCAICHSKKSYYVTKRSKEFGEK